MTKLCIVILCFGVVFVVVAAAAAVCFVVVVVVVIFFLLEYEMCALRAHWRKDALRSHYYHY